MGIRELFHIGSDIVGQKTLTNQLCAKLASAKQKANPPILGNYCKEYRSLFGNPLYCTNDQCSSNCPPRYGCLLRIG